MKIAWFILLILGFAECQAQNPVLTTFILVRHAEKESDGTKDPDLSTSGKARAVHLADLLKETSVTAIYSTDYKRTRNTLKPLATAKSLEIFSYEPLKVEAIDKIWEKHKGGTIVLAGHSNTIPWTANQLTGSQLEDFNESDYGNLLVITVTEKGKGKLTWLKY